MKELVDINRRYYHENCGMNDSYENLPGFIEIIEKINWWR